MVHIKHPPLLIIIEETYAMLCTTLRTLSVDVYVHITYYACD